MVVPRGCGRGSGELVFNKHRLSVWEDEEALEMPDDDGCTAL